MTTTPKPITRAHLILRIIIAFVRWGFFWAGIIIWFNAGFVEAAPYLWFNLVMAIEGVNFKASRLEAD